VPKVCNEHENVTPPAFNLLVLRLEQGYPGTTKANFGRVALQANESHSLHSAERATKEISTGELGFEKNKPEYFLYL